MRVEGRTYITAVLMVEVASLILNTVGSAEHGIHNWANQNAMVLVMLVLTIPALVIRNAFVQVVAPLGMVILLATSFFVYYPVLQK